MALKPEETVSKKKNRHEVTDLIKGEKYTSSRETRMSGVGSMAGGEGVPAAGSGHERGLLSLG